MFDRIGMKQPLSRCAIPHEFPLPAESKHCARTVVDRLRYADHVRYLRRCETLVLIDRLVAFDNVVYLAFEADQVGNTRREDRLDIVF